METLHLTIEGMSCAHCVDAVQWALGGVPGVEPLAVSVGAATVRYTPGQTAPAAILQVVSEEGYPARFSRPDGGGS